MKRMILIGLLCVIYMVTCVGCTGKLEDSTASSIEVETFEGDEKLIVYVSGTPHTFLTKPDENGNRQEDYKLYPSKFTVGFSIVGGEYDCPSGNIFAKAVEDFSKETHIPVDIQFFDIPGDQLQKMYDEGGKQPDLLLVGKTGYCDYLRLAEQGMLLDISEYASSDESLQDTEHYYHKVLEGGKIYNQQCIMPILFNMNGAMTSKSYLQSIGRQISAESDYEDILYVLEESCKAEMDSKTVEAIYETSGLLEEGEYVPRILLAAAYPSYFNDMEKIEIDPEVLQKVYILMDWYKKQDESVPYAAKSLELLDGDVYGLFGFFLSGGREGGKNYHNSLLTDATYLQSLYEDNDEEMVLCGIPTVEDPNAYSANISLSAIGLQSTKYPKAVYQLIRYLMDYEFPSFYGFSVNQEITEKQIQDIQKTTTTIYPDVMWGAIQTGSYSVEDFESMKMEMKPLKEEYAQTIEDMLDHISGAGFSYPILSEYMTHAFIKIEDGELSLEEAATWTLDHVKEYQTRQSEYKPFYDMAFYKEIFQE